MKSKKAKITYPDGAYYIGEVKDGKKHGKGTCVYPFGTYTGDFVDDILEGYGVFKYNDGSSYKGFFKQCKKDYKGEYITKDFRYVGLFKDDMMNGKGTIYWSSGDIYEGGFENNTLHGYGRLTYKNGLVAYGKFNHNALPTDGGLIFKNGMHYKGQLSGNKMHGYGCLEGYAEGQCIWGYFENNEYIHPKEMTRSEFAKLKRKSEVYGLPINYRNYTIAFPENYKPEKVLRKEGRKLHDILFKTQRLPPLETILQLDDYSRDISAPEKKKREAIYCLAKYFVAYFACAQYDQTFFDYANARIKQLEAFNDKSLKRKIRYLKNALEIANKIKRNERTDQLKSFVSFLMHDSSSIMLLGQEKFSYDDYDYSYSSSSSSSSDDKDVEEFEEKETIYINFRDGKKGIVVDDDSLSSYRGQLVVDEYTKEPTGLRYKDDHLYDDDGHDLGSFSDLGNFYPNR